MRLSCSTRRHDTSSSPVTSPSLPSSAVIGAYAAQGISAHVNFLPRNSCQASSSCFDSVSGLPSAALVDASLCRSAPSSAVPPRARCPHGSPSRCRLPGRRCSGDSRHDTLVRCRYRGIFGPLGSVGGSIVRAPRIEVSCLRCTTLLRRAGAARGEVHPPPVPLPHKVA